MIIANHSMNDMLGNPGARVNLVKLCCHREAESALTEEQAKESQTGH